MLDLISLTWAIFGNTTMLSYDSICFQVWFDLFHKISKTFNIYNFLKLSKYFSGEFEAHFPCCNKLSIEEKEDTNQYQNLSRRRN